MKLDNGKYEIKREGNRLIALRHGEPWRDLTGDNLIYWLMVKLEDEAKSARDLARDNVKLQARIEELESQNTFWACKKHTQQNTLRCAICDEQHIKELEASLDESKRLIGFT